MFPVFVVMASLTILISRVKWNFSFKLQRVDIKYRQTLCARGEGTGFLHSSLSFSLPVHHSPYLSITPSPVMLKSPATSFCCPPDWDFIFFSALGFVKCFLGFQAAGGAFFPFFIHFFFYFSDIFHGILGWDQCCYEAGLLPPPSSWLLPSILSATCAVSLRFCRSPFLLCGFLLASRAAQSAVKSIARAVAARLGEQAGLLPPPALSHTYLSSLHPFSFPRLNFFRFRTRLQQPFHY